MIDVENDRNRIYDAIREQLVRKKLSPDLRFGDGTAGAKIADVLATVKPEIQKKWYENE